MKSVFAAVILCALLAVDHALLRRIKEAFQFNKNPASSSSESEEKKHGSCLMHFVDKDILDHVYIANGALVDMNKVLTTRDFLEPYENSVKTKNLFVFAEKWDIDNLSQKVVDVYIDDRSMSRLAVARLERPFEPNKFISQCVASLLYSQHIDKMDIAISGWRIAGRNADIRISSRDALLSTLIVRECNSRRPKQKSFHRRSRAVAVSEDAYKDHNSIMSFGDEGAPVTSFGDRSKLLAIASFKEKVLIPLASSAVFFKMTHIENVEIFPPRKMQYSHQSEHNHQHLLGFPQ